MGQWGQEISDLEAKASRMRREQALIVQRERHYDRDNADLVEYVKWVSGDLSMLRDRARVSEKVISDLKRSGQESVDQLMEKLSSNKQKQARLDADVDALRAVIQGKEHEIARKEDEIVGLKRLIELETNEKEMEIRRIRLEIEEQNKVIENQQKIVKELIVLNDYTQTDLIQANAELQSRIREKNDLQLRYLDADQETANLHFRHNTLSEQAEKFEKQITAQQFS